MKFKNPKTPKLFKTTVEVAAIRSGVAFATLPTGFGEFQEINRDPGWTMLL
jgi:hypothetical protein